MGIKKFRQTSNALAAVWGQSGPSGTGSASQRDAANVGIKIDMPLTPSELAAQEIADELAAEHDAAEKAADPRSAFEKRYDIRGGVAHISSDAFRNLLIANDKMNKVCKAAHKIIITDGFGLTAEYIPAKNGAMTDKEPALEHTIIAQTILQIGVVQALGTHESAYLRSSHGHIRGTLRILMASDQIKAHAASLTDPDALAHTHLAYASSLNSYGSGFKGNFTQLFGNLAALRMALDEGKPINLTVDTLASGKVYEAMSLGTLYPANRLPEQPTPLKDIMFTDFKRLVWGFEPTDKNLLIRYVFSGSAGYRIFTHNTNHPPLAVLVSPYPPSAT